MYTDTEYWQKCAQAINSKFPSTTRNGLSCKALSQRLFLSPLTDHPTSSMDRLDDIDIADGFQMLSTGAEKCYTRDVETQTTLSLSVQTGRGDVKDGDRVFMEPRKVLQPGSSVCAEYLHQSVKKRLRQYPCLSDAEKASLIDVLCDGTPQQSTESQGV